MAKRYTDTEKWKDEWFGSLSNDYRIIWLWLVDNCSIAGFWKKDFRGLRFNCNVNISESEFLDVFGSRLVDCGNCFFVRKFLLFQYPKGLTSNKPMILSVIKELEKSNHYQTIIESLPNDYPLIKVTGKGNGNGNGVLKKQKPEIKNDHPENPIPEKKPTSVLTDFKPACTPELKEIKYPFDTDKFRSEWESWKEFKRKEFKFQYKSEQSENAALSSLAELAANEQIAIAIMAQSKANGWKGFFQLKNQTTNGTIKHVVGKTIEFDPL